MQMLMPAACCGVRVAAESSIRGFGCIQQSEEGMQHASWERPGSNPGPWGFQAGRIDHCTQLPPAGPRRPDREAPVAGPDGRAGPAGAGPKGLGGGARDSAGRAGTGGGGVPRGAAECVRGGAAQPHLAAWDKACPWGKACPVSAPYGLPHMGGKLGFTIWLTPYGCMG